MAVVLAVSARGAAERRSVGPPRATPNQMVSTVEVSISVAQTSPVKGDVQANIDEHLRLTDAAASEGSQMVIFPELSLTGYEIELADALSFDIADSRLAPLFAAASSHAIRIIVGAPVRIDARLYIGSLVLSPGGVAEVYTKHRLGAFGEDARRDGTVPPAEATVFHPGDRDPVIQLGRHSAALAICADIGRASHPAAAAARGASLYLASMFAIPSEYDGDFARLQRYAKGFSLGVALANFGSPSGGLEAAGRSSIWSPSGDLLVQLDARGSGVATASETADGWSGTAVMFNAGGPARR